MPFLVGRWTPLVLFVGAGFFVAAPRSFFCRRVKTSHQNLVISKERRKWSRKFKKKKPSKLRKSLIRFYARVVLVKSKLLLWTHVASNELHSLLSLFPIKPSLSFSVVRLPPFFFFLVLPSKTSGPRWWSCAVRLSISRDINVQPHPVVEAQLHALKSWRRSSKSLGCSLGQDEGDARGRDSVFFWHGSCDSFYREFDCVLFLEAQLQNTKLTL